MKFNLVFDRFVNDCPYPNLAELIDISRGYDSLWTSFPRTVPIRLFYYFDCFSYPYEVYDINDEFPTDSFYPIGVAWFDFSIDYIALLPSIVKEKVKQGKLRLLFYYHEGDNPKNESEYLNLKCAQHNIPANYIFITGNTEVQNLRNFVHFADHELFYYKANYKHPPIQFHNGIREKDFTVYNRVHKWWRATALTHLLDAELLDNSYWSYGNIDNNDQLSDNPIEIDILGLRSKTLDFINNAPYFCDQLNTTQHNRHSLLVPEHYSNSYIHIVFETFFDADQSQGTFLSEKTFKPIKHAQPFVLVAPAGSLKLLRELGYKTFDSVIDTSYDTIENNTERWIAVYNLINILKHSNLYDIYQKCKDDILHNQQHFMTCGYSRLYTLWRNIRDV